MKPSSWLGRFHWRTLPAFFAVGFFLFPVLWMLLTSVKLAPDTVALPPRLLPGDLAPENSLWFRFTLNNYARVFGDGDSLRPSLRRHIGGLCPKPFRIGRHALVAIPDLGHPPLASHGDCGTYQLPLQSPGNA
jgi:ABC-type glycerol-3-phosphate transport system permease component